MTEVALGEPPLTPSASPGDSLMRTPPIAQPATDLRRRVARLLLLRTLVVTVVLGLSLWLLLRSDSQRASSSAIQASSRSSSNIPASIINCILAFTSPALIVVMVILR